MKITKAMFTALFLALSCCDFALAEDSQTDNGKSDNIVISATRIETQADDVGSSISVVTSDELEARNISNAQDALRTVPGLDVVESGGPGSSTSVFLRGAKSEHTLILIDGIEANDPISPGRSYDFSSLTTDNIERIEVLRGPQSTLYGSDAMGGVINIITKRGSGAPTATLSAEGGSFNTFTEKANVSGGDDLVSYSASIHREDTGGISAADKRDGNSEKDGFKNTSFVGRLDITPSDQIDASVITHYIDSSTQTDNGPGVGGDDPNNVSNSKQWFLRGQVSWLNFSDIWEQIFGISLSSHDLKVRNPTDYLHPNESMSADYNSAMLKADWQNNINIDESNTLTLGLEAEREEGDSVFASESEYGPLSSVFDNKDAETIGIYAQHQISLFKDVFLSFGGRLDDHDKSGSNSTYRGTVAWHIMDTGLTARSSYATGFKNPTLYQLYSEYGNSELDPEKSNGWDFGLEQNIANGMVRVGVTWFDNSFKDLIDYDFNTSSYFNIAKATTRGFESFAIFAPTESLKVQSSYTWGDTEDDSTGEELLRRAKNKADLNINYAFQERANINFGLRYVGSRFDNDFSTWPATRVKMSDYTIFRLGGSIKVYDPIEIFARIENLFDKKYQEVLGYGTPGISGYVGIRASLYTPRR